MCGDFVKQESEGTTAMRRRRQRSDTGEEKVMHEAKVPFERRYCVARDENVAAAKKR